MYYKMSWQVNIGKYKLGMLAGVEVNRSVDVLAATCTIDLPGYAYNTALKVEGKLKKGDLVVVQLGYDGKLQKEFEGYLLSINTDGGKLTLNCEDDLFLFRRPVADKEFKRSTVKDIAQYLIDNAKVKTDAGAVKLICALDIDYDKFVISKASAYDVLKKLKEETKANIFLKRNDAGITELHIAPPYTEVFETVNYSFQQNIEKDDLKYVRKEDRKIEVVVNSANKAGEKKEVRYGTTGGQVINVTGNGMSEASMKTRAKTEYELNYYDGYEGSITGWLIPSVKPGDSVKIVDKDYEYKNGTYYVKSVTTTFGESGGSRKISLGKRLG